MNVEHANLLADYLKRNKRDLVSFFLSDFSIKENREARRVANLLVDDVAAYLKNPVHHALDWAVALIDLMQGGNAALTDIMGFVNRERVLFMAFCDTHIPTLSRLELAALLDELHEMHTQQVCTICSEKEQKILAAERRRHRALVELNQQPFIQLDKAGQIEMLNTAFSNLMGLPENMLLGKDFLDFCDEATEPELRRMLRRKRVPGTLNCVGGLLGQNNRKIRTEVNIASEFDEAGRRDGTLIALTPLTGDLSVAPSGASTTSRSQNPAFSREILEALARVMDMAMFVYDTSGEVIYANKIASQWLGVKECAPVPDASECEVPSTDEILQSTIRVEPPGAEGQWRHIVAVPLADHRGTITHVAKLVRDVTGQRSLEHQVLLKQSTSTDSQLAIAVAHELRNPLGIIIGFAEMLNQGMTGANVRETTQKLLRHGLRCKNIVDELLEFGRQHVENVVPANVNDILNEIVSPLFSSLEKPGIELHLADDLPPVECVPPQLGRVFAALLDNAVWAAQDKIVVTTDVTDEGVRIAVQDDGAGIPKADRDQIFTPFFSTRKEQGGTGLSLSMAKIVVEDFGGLLRLVPTSEGTQFDVVLPYAAEADITPSTAETLRPSVLLVDDEVDLVDMLETVLATEGYRTQTASTGAEAIDLIDSNEYDLLVLDILLPGHIGGKDIYYHLLDHHPEMAQNVLFITADTMNYETRQFLDQVGAPHMEKPFLVSDFTGRVSDAISG